MLKEIKRLTRLIADMMQLSGLQSGNIEMRMAPMNVSETVQDVAESYRAEIESKGLSLTVNTVPGAYVNADNDRVEQVLVILIDNAINYNKENGSIEVTSFRGEDGGVSVAVSNPGFGISEEDVPHIFDRFYTAKVSPQTGSTGLGLNIAKTIMEKMGGSISCTSSLGGVTTMRMDFAPVQTPED